MASKARGGLSKREYAAAQKAKAAPKVSVSVKKTASTPKVSGIGPVANGQQYADMLGASQGKFVGPYSPSFYDAAEQSNPNKATFKSSSKSSGSSGSGSPTKIATPTTESIRSKAANLKPADLKQGTSSWIGDTLRDWRNSFSNAMARHGNALYTNSAGRATQNAFLTDAERQANLNDSLGISTANAADYVFDPTTTDPAVNPYEAANTSSTMPFRTEGDVMQYNYDTGVTSGGKTGGATRSNVTGGLLRTNNSNRTPSPVSNPTRTTIPSFVPTTTAPAPQSFEPDLTPVSAGQPGTRRQFLGNGLLSNGMASNGKGDYGIQGTMGTGIDQNSTLDDILTFFGIKPMTAQAQEMPQIPSQQTNYGLNDYMRGNTSPVPGLSDATEYNMGGGLPQWNLPQTVTTTGNPGGSNSGGVAQQYAQPAQGNAVLDEQRKQEKGYKAQEKAQKQALKELLKSIRNQYETSTKKGLSDLNAAKVQDLIKLSGLFSFANQSPDSEQRIQYEQRANNDYAKQMAEYEAQQAAAMGQDISQAKQGYQSQMADIAKQRNATALEIAKLIQSMQGRSSGGSSRASSQKTAAYYAPDGSYTFNEVDPVSGLKIFYDQNNQPFING